MFSLTTRRKVTTAPALQAAESLLSPTEYDADAASIRSDQDSDSDDDERQMRARNSRELRAHDRLLLLEEEEMDHLVAEERRRQNRDRDKVRRESSSIHPVHLVDPIKKLVRQASENSLRGAFGGGDKGIQAGVGAMELEKVQSHGDGRKARWTRRKANKERMLAEARNGEDGALIREVEMGGIREGSSTSDSSHREDSAEGGRGGLIQMADTKRKGKKARRWWLLTHALFVSAFAVLVLMAWTLSTKSHRSQSGGPAKTLNNGTENFAPTTIIISLDGFRADFLQRGLTPRLNAFAAEGISPWYMIPSFPTVTFPNHFTIATGLYPEAHGVVGNSFWDPSLQAEFWYTDPDRSLDPKWWAGEPFWVAAEKQGMKTAIHMWPGSEARIGDMDPTYLDKFNAEEELVRKVDRILEFLDMPASERAQIIAAYVPNVDADGHKYGPNSTEIRTTIQHVDQMLDDVFKGLEQRNLTHIVNVIVVSDHGMATTDVSRLVQLEDLVDLDKIEHTDGWPLVGLRPKKPDDLHNLHVELKQKAKAYAEGLEVYLRDGDMPERYHFAKNERIAPLWIVPKTGWALVKMDEMNVQTAKAQGAVYHPRGLHGYDHQHPLMRAIFVARGPAFPHRPNSRVNVFQNIEVYNILCDSVGLEPRPNNGTLRLPLRPVGLHGEGGGPASEMPADPVETWPVKTEHPVGVDLPQPAPTWAVNAGQQVDDNSALAKIGGSASEWWGWLLGKVSDWMGKISDLGGDGKRG